jgi:hypothetical protein
VKVADVRNLDGIKGSFRLSEREYIATPLLQEVRPLPQLIYSNLRRVVEAQQDVIDSLWNKGIPAEQKIRDIDEER